MAYESNPQLTGKERGEIESMVNKGNAEILSKKKERERERGLHSRFNATTLQSVGYKEYVLQEKEDLDTALEILTNSRDSYGDAVISKDGKIMVYELQNADTGHEIKVAEGNAGLFMLDKLNFDNPEHKAQLKETGANFFRFNKTPRGDDRRDQIENEIATGTIERVVFTVNPDIVGFVYKKQQ